MDNWTHSFGSFGCCCLLFSLANCHFKRSQLFLSSYVMWSWLFSFCFPVTLQRKYPVESCFWSHLGCWVCTMHIWNSWFRLFSFSSCCFWQGKKCSKVREFVPVWFENWMAHCLVFLFKSPLHGTVFWGLVIMHVVCFLSSHSSLPIAKESFSTWAYIQGKLCNL